MKEQANTKQDSKESFVSARQRFLVVGTILRKQIRWNYFFKNKI
jgi:hypothetical protein